MLLPLLLITPNILYSRRSQPVLRHGFADPEESRNSFWARVEGMNMQLGHLDGIPGWVPQYMDNPDGFLLELPTHPDTMWFDRNFEMVLRIWNDCQQPLNEKTYCPSSMRGVDLRTSCTSDPMEIEFEIMKNLGYLSFPIVPHAYAISERKNLAIPASVEQNCFIFGEGCQMITGYSRNILTYRTYGYCGQYRTSYRAVLQDPVGPTFFEFALAKRTSRPKTLKKFYFQELVMMTRRIVGLLWRYHHLGYVHGNIDEQSTAFKYKPYTIDYEIARPNPIKYSALTDQMVLINLSRSRKRRDKDSRRKDLADAMRSLMKHLAKFQVGESIVIPEDESIVIQEDSSFSSEILNGFKASKGLQNALRNLDFALGLIEEWFSTKQVPYVDIIGALDRAILYSSCDDFVSGETERLRDWLDIIWGMDTSVHSEKPERMGSIIGNTNDGWLKGYLENPDKEFGPSISTTHWYDYWKTPSTPFQVMCGGL